MIRQPIHAKLRALLGAVAVVALLLGYTALSARQHRINPDDTTIPTWSKLADGAKSAIEVNRRSGTRWIVEDVKATLGRLFLGLTAGVVVAVLLGLSMGCFATVEAVFAPPLSLLSQVPPTAMLAVFFVLVGTDTNMYVAMIAFGLIPSLAQTVFLAVRDVPEELVFKAYTIGASHAEVIWNVIFPIILPKVLDAVRLQIGPAMVYLIAAEMVCGDVGFGYRIRLQSRLLNMNVVYPYLAVLATLGFTLNALVRGLTRALCPWHEKAR